MTDKLPDYVSSLELTHQTGAKSAPLRFERLRCIAEATTADAKRLNVHPTQLRRWLDADALYDQHGNVYIKTKGTIDL